MALSENISTLDELDQDLKELRAWVIANPGIVGWFYGLTFTIDVSPYNSSSYERLSLSEIADRVKAMAKGRPIGTVRKNTYGTVIEYVLKMGNGHARVEMNVPRDDVCVSRVVGQEEYQVPDPNAPKVTRTRDIVEWDCLPLLARAEEGS